MRGGRGEKVAENGDKRKVTKRCWRSPLKSTSMSDEDEPAPSPSAAVVARRASREAKSMREESGCDSKSRMVHLS